MNDNFMFLTITSKPLTPIYRASDNDNKLAIVLKVKSLELSTVFLKKLFCMCFSRHVLLLLYLLTKMTVNNGILLTISYWSATLISELSCGKLWSIIYNMVHCISINCSV